MCEIRISREEIEEMMKELDERKAIGPDGVSGYTRASIIRSNWVGRPGLNLNLLFWQVLTSSYFMERLER